MPNPASFSLRASDGSRLVVSQSLGRKFALVIYTSKTVGAYINLDPVEALELGEFLVREAERARIVSRRESQ